MPLQRCKKDNKNGYRWGTQGVCYTGPGAKKKAIKQGIAIEGPEKFAKIQKSGGTDFNIDEGNEALREYFDALPAKERLLYGIQENLRSRLDSANAEG